MSKTMRTVIQRCRWLPRNKQWSMLGEYDANDDTIELFMADSRWPLILHARRKGWHFKVNHG